MRRFSKSLIGSSKLMVPVLIRVDDDLRIFWRFESAFFQNIMGQQTQSHQNFRTKGSFSFARKCEIIDFWTRNEVQWK